MERKFWVYFFGKEGRRRTLIICFSSGVGASNDNSSVDLLGVVVWIIIFIFVYFMFNLTRVFNIVIEADFL